MSFDHRERCDRFFCCTEIAPALESEKQLTALSADCYLWSCNYRGLRVTQRQQPRQHRYDLAAI